MLTATVFPLNLISHGNGTTEGVCVAGIPEDGLPAIDHEALVLKAVPSPLSHCARMAATAVSLPPPTTGQLDHTPAVWTGGLLRILGEEAQDQHLASWPAAQD